jgi:copper chaperone CopZ
MRQLGMAATFIVAITAFTAAAQDAKEAVIKGPHICCKACVSSVNGILDKVEGVSNVKCDVKNKTVTFSAKDKATVEKALAAMYKGGFAGSATFGDATISKSASAPTGKADEVVVKDVHACCGQCKTAIGNVFGGNANVTITGSGAQRTVTIRGKDLNPADVLQKLNKAGFNGTIEK